MAITQATKAPRKTTTKPPGHIPRPPNAFILFRKDLLRGHPEVQPFLQLAMSQEDSQDSTHAQSNISKQASRIWEQMKPADKVHWFRMQEEAKRKHHEDYPDYKYQPQRQQKRRKLVATTDLMPLVEEPIPSTCEDFSFHTSGSNTPVSEASIEFSGTFDIQHEAIDYFSQSFPHQLPGPPSDFLYNGCGGTAAAVFSPQELDGFSGQTEPFNVANLSSAYVDSFSTLYNNYASGSSHVYYRQSWDGACIDPRLLTLDQPGSSAHAPSTYPVPGEGLGAYYGSEPPQSYFSEMNFNNGL